MEPFKLQLLTFLKFIGTNGSNGSIAKVGELIGYSTGPVITFVLDVVDVILMNKQYYLNWPE